MDNNKFSESPIVVLSQVFVVFGQDMVILSIGSGLGYSTVLIPGLSKDSESLIKLNEDQLSWIGSILLISCLLGCTLSGLTKIIGTIRVMRIAMVPFFLSWILMHFSQNVLHVYISLTGIGIASGVVEASVFSYIAEISQPHLRGMFSASTTISLVFGMLLQYLIGTSLPWRSLALFSSIFPMFAFLALWFAPESPYWLIARNKIPEARKSLSFLRGWAKIENIEKEFQELYTSHQSNLVGIPNPAFEDSEQSNVDQSYVEKLKQTSINVKLFMKPSFIHPFALVSFLFFLANFVGSLPLLTYGINVVTTLRIPLDPYYAIFYVGVANFLGALVSVFAIPHLGKRVIGFLSLFGTCIGNICLGVYAFLYNIKYMETRIYEEHTQANPEQWIPLGLMLLISFSAFLGITTLPWMLIGEIYTYETREIATGLSGAIYFITATLSIKMFFDMVSSLYFFGVLWFYGCVSLIGIIVTYFVLPETEGKTMKEILDHFSGCSKLDNNVRQR